MKKLFSYSIVAGMLTAMIFLCAAKPSFKTYILSNVKVECITQCDFTGSDQVYITIPETSINHKTSLTRAFKPGNVKAYTEIGPNSGSGTTAWFIQPGDKIRVYEKDLIDSDDLIKEISVTSTICNGQPQTVTGLSGSGKYKITFTIVVI